MKQSSLTVSLKSRFTFRMIIICMATNTRTLQNLLRLKQLLTRRNYKFYAVNCSMHWSILILSQPQNMQLSQYCSIELGQNMVHTRAELSNAAQRLNAPARKVAISFRHLYHNSELSRQTKISYNLLRHASEHDRCKAHTAAMLISDLVSRPIHIGDVESSFGLT